MPPTVRSSASHSERSTRRSERFSSRADDAQRRSGSRTNDSKNSRHRRSTVTQIAPFDAAARPMFAEFSRQPNLQPYDSIAPTSSLTERNVGQSTGSRESARLDFSHEDRVDDNELNAILWRAVKKSEPPAPVRSSFVRPSALRDEDDLVRK